MNSVVEDTLNKLKQCDDFHNRCDCLLEHSEITYLLDYIQQKENIIKEVREYIKQLLEYKKEDYYKGVSLDYVERILDILEGDLKYE